MEEAYAGPERRRFKRIKKEIIIKLHVYPEDQVALKGEHDDVPARNISPGGTLLSYGTKVEVGRFVDVRMKFPGVDEPVKCLGKVIRIEQPKKSKGLAPSPLYHIAVRFIETRDKKEEDIIRRIVEEHHFTDMHGKK